jgi:hypothetical protein
LANIRFYEKNVKKNLMFLYFFYWAGFDISRRPIWQKNAGNLAKQGEKKRKIFGNTDWALFPASHSGH